MSMDPEMIERPCYSIREPGLGKVLIPGCYGAAVYGPRGCTCGPRQRQDYLGKLEQRIGKLEAMIAKEG